MSEKEIPRLYKEKDDCCGCGACLNSCPVSAIEMHQDSCGYLYPHIDEDKCIVCHSCIQSCNYQKSIIKNNPLLVYAAAIRDGGLLRKSSSGGIAAELSRVIINNKGVVYGAAYDKNWRVKHLRIDCEDNIFLLQGSKYVQSDTGLSYQKVREDLESGNKVLFIGTPCQVDGLYGFLKKEYKSLTTIDLVCHGVPNAKMLSDYICFLENKYKGKIVGFTFRDKELGWGANGSAIIQGSDYRKRKIKIWESSSSYVKYFTNGWLYRENCYECKYACSHRPGDITLGDFWGIEKCHFEYLGKGRLDDKSGISMVMINTKRGGVLFDEIKNSTVCLPSSYEKASLYNGNLKKPSKKGKRDEIVGLYRNGGWKAVDDRFVKQMGLKRYSGMIKSALPIPIKRFLKHCLK